MLSQLNIPSNDDEYEKLENAYSEKQRVYHTKQHISECLTKLDWAASMGDFDDVPEIEMALWYHDAVYNTKGNSNELLSARLCKAFLVTAGIETDRLETIYNLIMATQHSALPEIENAKLVVDVDLSILGASEERFQEYESQIRKEYQWVPWLLYKKKRSEILTSFLTRPRIYFTEIFYSKFEEVARQNLKSSIAKLK